MINIDHYLDATTSVYGCLGRDYKERHRDGHRNRDFTAGLLHPARPRLPPYAREVISARRAGETNVHVHVGISAWDRAATWAPGHRVVVPLDLDHSPDDYNFYFLRGLAVTINAVDADLIIARRVSIAIVEQGAAMAVMLHPHLPKHSEFFYGRCK